MEELARDIIFFDSKAFIFYTKIIILVLIGVMLYRELKKDK